MHDVDAPIKDNREACVEQVDCVVSAAHGSNVVSSAAGNEQRPESSLHTGPGGEGPVIESEGLSNGSGTNERRPIWYKLLFYVEKALVVSSLNRLTCGK